MARVPEYRRSGQIVGPVNQRNATGEDFGAAQGRATQELGGTLERIGGEMNVRAEQREISRLNADMAKAQADLTIELQQDLNNADPNDDSFGSNFQAKVQARMSAIGDTAETRGGKLFFEKAGADTSAHFFQNASLGQIQLAGQAAKQNYLASVDSLSVAANANPMNYQFLQQQADLAAQNMPGLTTEQKLAMSRESSQKIAESAMLGMVQQDPYNAKEAFERGDFDADTDGQMRQAMINRAESGIEAREVDARKAETLAEKARKEENNAAALEYGAGFMTGEKSVEQMLADPAISDDGTQRALIGLAKSVADNDQSGTKNAKFREIWSGVLDNKINDPNVILAAVSAPDPSDRITAEQATQLMGLFQGKKGPLWQAQVDMRKAIEKEAFIKLAKPNEMGLADPEGQARYNAWLSDYATKYDEDLRNGLDPMKDLLNPDSPNYIVKSVPIRELTADQQMDALQSEYSRLLGEEAATEGATVRQENGGAVTTEPTQTEVDMSQFNAPEGAPGVGLEPKLWQQTTLSEQAYGKKRDEGATHEEIMAEHSRLRREGETYDTWRTRTKGY